MGAGKYAHMAPPGQYTNANVSIYLYYFFHTVYKIDIRKVFHPFVFRKDYLRKNFNLDRRGTLQKTGTDKHIAF